MLAGHLHHTLLLTHVFQGARTGGTDALGLKSCAALFLLQARFGELAIDPQRAIVVHSTRVSLVAAVEPIAEPLHVLLHLLQLHLLQAGHLD